MVQSDALWNDVLEVWAADKKSNDAKRCFLLRFETMFWKFELLGINWKHGDKMVPYDAIWNDVLEVAIGRKFEILGNDEKKLKARGEVVHSNTI